MFNFLASERAVRLQNPTSVCLSCSLSKQQASLSRASRKALTRCAAAAAPTSTITTQEGEGRSLTISTTSAQGKGPGTSDESLESVKSFLQGELASLFSTGVRLLHVLEWQPLSCIQDNDAAQLAPLQLFAFVAQLFVAQLSVSAGRAAVWHAPPSSLLCKLHMIRRTFLSCWRIFCLQRLTTGRYAEDFKFQDPTFKQTSLRSFQQSLTLLKNLFIVKFQVHRIEVRQPAEIVTR